MPKQEVSNQVIEGSVSKTRPNEPQKPRKKKRKRYLSPQLRLTLAVLRLTVIGYVTLLVALLLMEPRLVYPGAYFPDREVQDASSAEIETVEYVSTDGVTLRGRLIVQQQSPEIVLFFHGNGVKAKWMDHWLRLLAEEFGATAMIAEYRGYDDDTTPDEKGVLADCFAARDYLCSRFQKSPRDLILYGQSLGGGCAVAVASRGGAKAMVLERTFDRLVNVAADKYPIVPVRWLMRNRYDSVAKLTVYDGPLVMLHGTNDELIPIHHAQTLFAAAPCERKHWIPVQGLGHNDELPVQSLRKIVTKVRELTAQR